MTHENFTRTDSASVDTNDADTLLVIVSQRYGKTCFDFSTNNKFVPFAVNPHLESGFSVVDIYKYPTLHGTRKSRRRPDLTTYAYDLPELIALLSALLVDAQIVGWMD